MKLFKLVCFVAEIPDFLSEFEIQFMISKAKQQNMAESEAKSGLSKQAEYVKSAGMLE